MNMKTLRKIAKQHDLAPEKLDKIELIRGIQRGHMSSGASVGTAAKSPLDLLDETYARGEVSREEYLRRREDLLKC